MQKLKITPANIADAIGFGIDETNLPNAGHRPVSKSKNPVTMKAPMALLNGSPSEPAAINSAAPGVLQTILIGILYRKLKKIDKRP